MTDLNSVNLGGRITKDAVLEKTKENLSLVRVSMAVNRSTKKKDSEEYVDKPVFVDFTIFGNYAESMFKYFTKGTYITVQGHLDMDSWTSTDGKKKQDLKLFPMLVESIPGLKESQNHRKQLQYRKKVFLLLQNQNLIQMNKIKMLYFSS